MQNGTNSINIAQKELATMQYNHKTITKVLNRDLWALRYRKDGKQKTVYGKTQKNCIENYKKILKQKTIPKTIEAPKEPPKPKTYTLKEWYEKFKELYKVNKVKDTTIEKNDGEFKHLKALHNVYINELTIMQVIETFNKMKDGSRKRNTFILLKSMLEKAKINDLVSTNFMQKIDKPKYKAPERIALNKTQEQKFVKLCEQNKYGNFYLICLYQGLRRGECRGLRVNDIDLKNNTLTIDESFNIHTKRTNTKNEQSNRTMPIFEKSKKFLKELVKDKKAKDFIFPYDVDKLNSELKEIVKGFKFKKFTLHNLRHTFITRCQELNIPLYVIQSWVGHEKGSVVTTKIYTHLTQETNLKYAEIVNKE